MERSSITAEYAFRTDPLPRGQRSVKIDPLLNQNITKNIKGREIESRESKSNPCFRHPFPAHDSAKSGGSDLIRPVSRSKRHGNISAHGGGGGSEEK